MKTTYSLVLIFLILRSALWADSVSIDDFKKMNGMDREKAIQQAPPEQKEELKKIDLHLLLVRGAGGEAGLKAQKERVAIRVRGLQDLEGILIRQTQLWDSYVNRLSNDNEKARIPHEKQVEVEKKLLADGEALRARIPIVHAIIVQIAPSPSALELEKRIEKFDKDLADRFGLSGWNGVGPKPPLATKAEWDKAANQINEFIEEMKALPKLTPEQAQKEYDAVTDDKVRPWD